MRQGVVNAETDMDMLLDTDERRTKTRDCRGMYQPLTRI